MRIQQTKQAKDRDYQKKLFADYLKTHTDLSKQMVNDYKRYSINKFFTEMYCKNDDDKYIGKNRDLIERAQFGGDKWRRAKEMYDAKMAGIMKKIKKENIPEQVKASIMNIYAHYIKYVEVKDLDDCVAQ